jgi:hypothetical protein
MERPMMNGVASVIIHDNYADHPDGAGEIAIRTHANYYVIAIGMWTDIFINESRARELAEKILAALPAIKTEAT